MNRPWILLLAGPTTSLGPDVSTANAQRMYWTAFQRIQHADLDGSKVADLITNELNEPTFIAVDPAGQQM